VSDDQLTAPLTVETQYRYEPLSPIGEGWIWLRNQFDPQGYWSLYDDPKDMSPSGLHWVELRQIRQQRTVTEWEDVDA
jgi:hypothetical protein